MLRSLAVSALISFAAVSAQAQATTGYPVAQARYDQMFAIGNIAMTEDAMGQIGSFIQVGASYLHMSEITIIAYEGMPIHSENADWITIQNGLISDGYSVLVDDVAGTARISWN